MNWTFEDYRVWVQYSEQRARNDVEDKLRAELKTHGRQQLLTLFDELIKRMAFEEDVSVMKGRRPRTYAEACEELAQCLGSMKLKTERTHDASIY